MSELTFSTADDGQFRVTGPLGFETVHGIWEQSRAGISAAKSPCVDLGEVSEVDSAGLALVLEWISCAEANGAKLLLRKVPRKLMDLARISEVAELLDAASAGEA